MRGLTLTLAGGVDATSLRFFCDARRTMGRIVLKFCIAYEASFAQLLLRKNCPAHIRSRSYDVTKGTRSGHFCEKYRNMTHYVEGDIDDEEASFDLFMSELT